METGKTPIIPSFTVNNDVKLSDTQKISMLWDAINANLLPGWVFGGIMRRHDAEFLAEGTEDIWFAVAAKEGNLALGPVPVIQAGGPTPTAAMSSLMRQLADMRNKREADDQC